VAPLRICSWNINGLRASLKTGDFQGWLTGTQPDIVGLQEVKALPEQVDQSPWLEAGYRCWWHPADRAGYSGALLLSRVEPLDVRLGLGIPEYDVEGRVIEADYPGFTLITAYFPNSGRGADRLEYKLAFCEALLAHANELRQRGRPVLVMGDLNIAHTEIDLARPEENLKSAGFLPAERACLDRILDEGYVDTFRRLHPDARDAYTYWEPWRDRRARNIGWRIDYVVVSEDLMPAVKEAFIESSVMGSDHCPVGVVLDLG
jgi:exodeoxyribonuclease-3